MDTDAPESPMRLIVSTRSGRVVIESAAGDAVEVEGASISTDAEGVRIDGGSNAVSVRCPHGSHVTVSTMTGRIECRGELGDVRATTSTGKVLIDAARSVDARSRSGRVEVGECGGACRIVSGSGRIVVGSAHHADLETKTGSVEVADVGDADVQVVSGRIEVGTRRGSNVKLRSMTGEIRVGVPTGVAPATILRAKIGAVRCDCTEGHDGTIDAKTITGSIRVGYRS